MRLEGALGEGLGRQRLFQTSQDLCELLCVRLGSESCKEFELFTLLALSENLADYDFPDVVGESKRKICLLLLLGFRVGLDQSCDLSWVQQLQVLVTVVVLSRVLLIRKL